MKTKEIGNWNTERKQKKTNEEQQEENKKKKINVKII